jgi:hypothetical protein
MDSLLVNVSKYAASNQTSPIENFITEAFAWVLKHDDNVRKALNDLLSSKAKESNIAFQSLCDSNDVETQVNFGGKFPDLLWTDVSGDFCAIFEHKVWSELHTDQLSNYRQYAHSHLGKEFIIVLITAHTGQHRQFPDIALCWYDIVKTIENLEQDDDKTNWLRSEFINLLESNGLVNNTPLNPLAISYYNDAKDIDKQLYEIVRRSEYYSWPVYEPSNTIKFNHPPRHRNARGRYDTWGRIGLEFSTIEASNDESGWKPALFSGFIVDGYDHSIPDLMKNGPIAAVILSVNKETQQKLNKNGCYDRLVIALNERLPTGWKLSDRTKLGKSYNHWHPLIIYCSLTDFIYDASTLDQQSERFKKQQSKLQRIFLDLKEFTEFCNEMQTE